MGDLHKFYAVEPVGSSTLYKRLPPEPCYEHLYESAGWSVEYSAGRYGGGEHTGVLLLKRGDDYGLAVYAYGSCSGCDALEACDTDIDAIEALRDGLVREIKVCRSEADALSWIENDLTQKNPWFLHDKEVMDDLVTAAKKLGEVVN